MVDRLALARAIRGEENPPVPTEAELKKALALLDYRERFFLEHRFTRPFMTLKAIGAIYPRADGSGVGVSPERMRQKEAAVLRKLRKTKHRGMW